MRVQTGRGGIIRIQHPRVTCVCTARDRRRKGSPDLVGTLRQCTINGWQGEQVVVEAGKEDRVKGMNGRDREKKSEKWQLSVSLNAATVAGEGGELVWWRRRELEGEVVKGVRVINQDEATADCSEFDK